MEGDYWELASTLQPWSILLAALGAGAVAIHQTLFFRVPVELVLSHSTTELHALLRATAIRSSLNWIFGLLFLPLVVFDLLELAPWLLPQTSFLQIRDWATHGPVLATLAAVALLLAARVQQQAVKYRASPFNWHLGAYTVFAVGALALWFFAGLSIWLYETFAIEVLITMGIIIVAVLLLHSTRSPTANFCEAITA
jgi:hypothetical protein